MFFLNLSIYLLFCIFFWIYVFIEFMHLFIIIVFIQEPTDIAM